MKQYITALALFACVSFCSAMDSKEAKRQKVAKEVAVYYLKNGQPEKALEAVPLEQLMPLLSEEMLKKLPANSLGELCHHICNAKLQKIFSGPLEAVIKKYVQNVLKSHKSIGLFYDKNTKTQKAIADVTALNESLKSLQAVVELEIETDNGLSYWQSPVGQAIRISNRKYEVALLTMMTDLLQMINSVQQLCLAKTCLKEIEKIPNIPPFLKQVNRAKYLSYKKDLLCAQNEERPQDEKIKKQNTKIKDIITAINEGSIKSKKGFLYPYFESLLDYVTLVYQTTQSLSPKQEEFYAKLINQSTNPATAIRASLNYLTILIDTHPDFVKKPQIHKNIHKCINHLRNIKDPGLNNKAAGICAWAFAKEYEQTTQAKKPELKAQIEQLLEKYERASGQNIPALSSLGQQSLDIFLSRIGDAYSKIGKTPGNIDNESQFVYCMNESEKCFYSDPKKSFKLATLASEIAPTPQKKAHAALLLATLCLAKEDIKAAHAHLEENENLIAQGQFSDEDRNKLQAQTTFTRGCVLLFRDVAAACEQFEKALAIADPSQTVQTLSFYIPGLCMKSDFCTVKKLLQIAQQSKEERNGTQKLRAAEEALEPAQWLAWGLTQKNEREAKKWLQKAAQQDKNRFIQQLAQMYRAGKLLAEAAKAPEEKSVKLQKKSSTLLKGLIRGENYNPWAFAQAQSMYGLLYLRLKDGVTEITDETIEKIKKSKALPYLKAADSQTINDMAKAEAQPVLCALAEFDEKIKRITWTATQEQNRPKKLWAYDQLACDLLRQGSVDRASALFSWLAKQEDPAWQKPSQQWLDRYQKLLDYAQ